ncbi:extracellular solute-binding protein [Paenibacillus sp. GCM10027626]|uniref:extracellular solute-binding protein n=1 Tax=Paenibacillus sp. GCM10027626 TaxID=3273411 RepID=UPI0036416F2C
MLAKKGQLMLLLAACVSIAGCSGSNGDASGNGNNSKNANTGDQGKKQEEEAALPMINGKYDPPVTITTVKKIATPTTFKNGETADDNVHYKWAEEKLGIKIENLWSVVNTSDAYNTKLKLMLSSNEKLPDVVFAAGEVAQMLIDSGKFREVGPLFDQYASESWKQAMNEAPTAWYEFTRDGKRYGIPNLDYDYNNDPVLWVRKDWMEKLGLPEPVTIDDYEKMLDAFKNNDPDGNGKADTYGTAVGLKDSYGNMFSLSWVFGAYGSLPEMWLEQADGKLGYGSVQPQIKEGLAKLKDWVQKGYIPMEAGIWDQGKAGSFMSAGKAGSFTGPFWSEAWPMGDMNVNNPQAELTTFKLPTGPDGKTMHYGSHPYTGALLINKDMEHPEIFFTYANYLFDHVVNPEAGSEYEHGWAEGYDWAKVDGEVTYDLNKVPGGGVRVFFYSLLDGGPRIPSLNVSALVKVAANGKAETPYEKIWSGFVPPIELESATDVWNQRDTRFKNAYTGGSTETMKLKWDYLRKLELKTFSDIIFGDKPVDSFDDFVTEWKSQGGDRITEEVNEWYTSVAGK